MENTVINIIDQVCEEICNNYCKKPDEYTTEEWDKVYEDVCSDCPLNRLR